MAREMKDSGIEWIGKIPKDWEVVKVKRLFSIGRGRVISKLELKESGYPVYSSQTKNNGILGYIETYDFDKSQITWTTDGANAGTIFLREGKYNCTNVCGTLLPKKESEKLKFIEYALKFITPYYKRADINGFKIMNNEMAEIPVVYPLFEEQEKIANYLDKKVADIDLIIEKTKVTIEDYKKYKQSIITEAVTKGLNPNVEMKDSGIEWIGQIPKHWKVTKVKHYIKIENGKDPKTEGDIPVYGSGSESFKTCGEYKIGPTVLLGRKGATLHIPHYIEGKYWNVDTAFNTIPNTKISLRYFYFLACCFDYKYYISQTTLPGMTQTNYGNIYIPFPEKKEQQQIADYLDKKVSEIDNLISKKESLISEMEEYKKSLIYECVTGKKEINVSENKFEIFKIETSNKLFSKAVLVAKIADMLEEKKGKVAVAKILYLTENSLQMDYDSIIEREVAGPLDKDFYNIESILRKQKWYRIKKYYSMEIYAKAENKEKYKKYYEKYFGKINDKIEELINKLKNFKTQELEMLATLYASINDLKIENVSLEKEKIVEYVYSWNESKKRFSEEEWIEKIDVLNELNIIPKGYGNKTVKKI